MSWFRRLTGRGGPAPAGPDTPPAHLVELLFAAPPRPDAGEILRAIRAHRPAAEAIHEPGATTLMFAHPDLPVHLQDGTVHPLTTILPADEPYEPGPTAAADLAQSWLFPEAGAAVARCRHSLVVANLMATMLDRRTRLELFQDALAGILQALPAAAIDWPATGQFIDPARFVEAYRAGGATRFFHGALNVRYYRIDDTPGDQVMDTRGMAAFGLPDLQCHFRDLDPPGSRRHAARHRPLPLRARRRHRRRPHRGGDRPRHPVALPARGRPDRPGPGGPRPRPRTAPRGGRPSRGLTRPGPRPRLATNGAAGQRSYPGDRRPT